ncbi:alpha/beta hydrolase family protein [Plantactinospora solaniradicis]|uniref:Alpha/beta hydrolase family protein n=1 Tax=Plantactinospora solaniradicis TaxID=1723736 RepID=A0ABW1K9E4_9ACTN
MRRLLMPAMLALALVTGASGPATAAPPGSPPPHSAAGGWSVTDGRLTWRSDTRVPMGDAAVEFWSGDRRLGRARPHPDGRTFSLGLRGPVRLDELTVRAGGKRIDQAPPRGTRRSAPVAAAPAPQPAAAVDPGVTGPYRSVTGEYDLPAVKLPDFPEKVEMRAVVVAPQGTSGARPLALFLHGRHSVCYRGDAEVPQQWPCPAGTDPIPSHRGYLQAQRLLASQGYLTVSISANGVNGQDWEAEDGGAQARSSLVRLHLAKWADWAGAGRAGAPPIVRAAPRADLSRVFLMGHSRGGEGVSRAAMDSLTPPPAARDGYHGRVHWTVRGLLLIGPTIFGHDPVPDVPSATILPGCDGDVFDQQGQMFVDETRGVSHGRALHSALYVVGANHNFFNTEWTPGQSAAPSFDDFRTDGEPDPVCSPGTATRLTAAQQQTVGATYIAAAARLFVGGDDRARPLFDGSGRRAPSADPARVLSHALGGNRTPLITPDQSTTVSGGARICDQVTDDAERSCLDPEDRNALLAHFVPFAWIPEPGRYAAALNWSAAGSPIRLAPSRPVTVAGARDLALRVIVPPNTTGTRFDVTVVGTDGRRSTLGEVRIDGLPGTDNTTSYWGQEVRVPLKGAPTRVAAIELTPRTPTGRAWLLDAWGWKPGTPDPGVTRLPRLDIGNLEVTEGDSGTKTYEIPVTVTGRGGGLVRLFLFDDTTFTSRSWLATVRPGQRTIRVPIEITGDTLWNYTENRTLTAKAERGFVIGSYVGGVSTRNDDPEPTLSIESDSARVAEGGTLTWRFSASAPTETGIFLLTVPQPPASGVELSTTDVDPNWFVDNAFEPVEPERPLSQTWLTPYLFLDPDTSTGELTVPTITDSTAEPDEVVELHFAGMPEGPVPSTVLTGVVTGG